MPPRSKSTASKNAQSAVNPAMAPNVDSTSEPAPKRSKKAKAADARVDTVTLDDFNALLIVNRPDDSLAKHVSLPRNHKTDVTHLSDGMLLCRPARIVVLNASSGNTRVRNQDIHASSPGQGDWDLGTSLIASQCWNADQYTEVRQESMTTIASILRERVGDVICKVEFTKEPVPNEMRDLLMKGAAMIEQLFTTEAEKQAAYKRLYERTRVGEYRIMRGYILRDEDLSTQESETGMIKFLDADLMAQGKFAERQVNLRNIKALTFKNVRYERKA